MSTSPIPLLLSDPASTLATPAPSTEFSALVDAYFDALDRNDDGFISSVDLDHALQAEEFKGKTAAMVAAVRNRLADFEEMSDDEFGDEDDGITRADLAILNRLRASVADGTSPRENDTKAAVRIENNYFAAVKKIRQQNRSLLDASGKLDPSKVMQGSLGDCWFIAAVICAVERDETQVRNMISPLPGKAHTFSVSMPGAPVNPVEVGPLTDGEIATFASASTNGIWMGVLEKALADAFAKDALYYHGTNTMDEIDDARMVSAGIEVITGHGTDTDILSTTRKTTTRAKLIAAFDQQRLVAAQIRKHLTQKRTDDGLPAGHIYSVTGFDADVDMLFIRNPWGAAESFGSAFAMSLEVFDENFTTIAYEEPR